MERKLSLSLLTAGRGACCAEAIAEQKITADSTAILFMALLLTHTTDSLDTGGLLPGQPRVTRGREARAERWRAELLKIPKRPGEEVRADLLSASWRCQASGWRLRIRRWNKWGRNARPTR